MKRLLARGLKHGLGCRRNAAVGFVESTSPGELQNAVASIHVKIRPREAGRLIDGAHWDWAPNKNGVAR
jgi:hypothetical protein